MVQTLVQVAREYVEGKNPVGDVRAKALSDLEKDLPAIEAIELGIERLVQERLYEQRLKRAYPVIDPSFLSMRHRASCVQSGKYRYEEGIRFRLPRFGIYSLASPVCSFDIDVRTNFDYKIEEVTQNITEPAEVHEVIEEPFREAIKVKPEGRPYNKLFRSNFSSEFIGIIPECVRKELAIAKRAFGEHLYVVAEVKKWNQKVTMPIAGIH